MQETSEQYTQRISGYVKGQDPLRVQRSTAARLKKIIGRLSRKRLQTRPAPGKWSIAEILAHLADAELVGSWRIRLVLTQNGVPIQAYDQNAWAETFQYRGRDPKVSLDTFRVLRASNLALLQSVPRKLWQNYGVHEERGNESIARLVEMFAGHDLNHLRQVESIVKVKPSRRKTK
jgi:DinB superfamily